MATETVVCVLSVPGETRVNRHNFYFLCPCFEAKRGFITSARGDLGPLSYSAVCAAAYRGRYSIHEKKKRMAGFE